MTLRFKKKNRKWRGRTSRGWGMKKKRRGGGSRGGRGYSGMHKHKYTLVTTQAQDWYGQRGFTSLSMKARAVNVGDLEKIGGGKREIDLSLLGYGKLLARGRAPEQCSVKVAKATARAVKKIESAGGRVIITKPEEAKESKQNPKKSN